MRAQYCFIHRYEYGFISYVINKHKLDKNHYNYITSCVSFMLKGTELRNKAYSIYRVVYFFHSPMKSFCFVDARTQQDHLQVSAVTIDWGPIHIIHINGLIWPGALWNLVSLGTALSSVGLQTHRRKIVYMMIGKLLLNQKVGWLRDRTHDMKISGSSSVYAPPLIGHLQHDNFTHGLSSTCMWSGH